MPSKQRIIPPAHRRNDMGWLEDHKVTLSMIVALVTGAVAVVRHFIMDEIRFAENKRDVKWIKAALRKLGVAAPNGDDQA